MCDYHLNHKFIVYKNGVYHLIYHLSQGYYHIIDEYHLKHGVYYLIHGFHLNHEVYHLKHDIL